MNSYRIKVFKMNNKSTLKMCDSNESLVSGVSSAGDFSPVSAVDFDLGGDTLKNSERTRNKSSGSCNSSIDEFDENNHIEAFPSLSDEVLEEMGLIGDQSSEFQRDEELETKFITLSLAFSIDSKTIKDRCERQRRSRDQTEKNLAVEIERLTERVNRLTRLCVDKESTVLLDALLTQIDIVVKASALASSSAERYGAVQHEARLSEAVQLMVTHVTSLKQQRDLSKKQLEYTKKVLQGNNTKEENSPRRKNDTNQAQNTDRRRASIAVGALGNPGNLEKPLARRTSELGFRTGALRKTSKNSRTDLGADLDKIKEKMVEETNPDFNEPFTERNTTGCDESDDELEKPKKLMRSGLFGRFDVLKEKATTIYTEWSDQGMLSQLFYICAVLCFCFGVIVMADVLFEIELSKR